MAKQPDRSRGVGGGGPVKGCRLSKQSLVLT